MFKIAFIIVTFNGENYVEKCIDSIKKYFQNSYIIVVDNDSKDGTLELLKNLNIDHLIISPMNVGFGRANNLGLRHALLTTCDAFFLVNQDVYFHSGNVTAFLKMSELAFTDQNYGVVSPLHLAPNTIDYDFRFRNCISEKNTPQLLQNILKKEHLDMVYPSKAVNAAAWLFSKNCIAKVGVFDPIFPHYGEDTDYIKRLRFHQLKIGVIPNLSIVHNRPQTEIFSLEKSLYRMKMWSLTYFKDINKSVLQLILRYPFQLRHRIYVLKVIWGSKFSIYFKTIIFLIRKSVNILKNRRKSKTKGSFIK